MGDALLVLEPGQYGSLAIQGPLATAQIAGLVWGELPAQEALPLRSGRWTYDFAGGLLSEVYALDISFLGERDGRVVVEGTLNARVDPNRFDSGMLSCDGVLEPDTQPPSLIDSSISQSEAAMVFDELVAFGDAQGTVGDMTAPVLGEPNGLSGGVAASLVVRADGLWAGPTLQVRGVQDTAGNGAEVSLTLPAPLTMPVNDNLGFEGGLAPWVDGIVYPALTDPAEVSPVEGSHFVAVDASSLNGSTLRGRLAIPTDAATLTFSIGMLDLRDVGRYFNERPVTVSAHWVGGERVLWTGDQYEGALDSDVWSGWIEVTVPVDDLPGEVEIRFRNLPPAPPVYSPVLVLDALRFTP